MSEAYYEVITLHNHNCFISLVRYVQYTVSVLQRNNQLPGLLDFKFQYQYSVVI